MLGVEMRSRPRSISITSGKGGTGKTTVTANLGIALGILGKRVTILDADLTMANLSIVMGMHQVKTSFLDVLAGKADLSAAIYENHGIKIVPTGFRFEDSHEALSKAKRQRVEEAINKLIQDTDFLLIDAPAGIQDATIVSIAAANEMLAVCNPTYTSLVDAYKVIRYANVIGAWTRGVVANRVGKRAELPSSEIEQFMGKTLGSMPVLAEIPEDSRVQEAELEGVPVVVYEPNCAASVAINRLAKVISSEAALPQISDRKESLAETTRRLARALTARNV